ncbi:MAG: AraC family transcriptional regulator [Bacteroidetes bacterium HGW-Bacteroidetes-22]|nr:MAG: AraC family transcriptional regulator [Bacteroidetes bacterium HGW-Bacteroidetes-22]
MVLQIKNMKSNHCIVVVKNELERHGLDYKSVSLGEIEITNILSEEELLSLTAALDAAGLELMIDKNSRIIESIKHAIHLLIYDMDNSTRPNFSIFIAQKVNFNYTYLSTLFSKTTGITIEKYIIKLRVQRVKEMLHCKTNSLGDIAFALNYSSIAHLSNQFKKITGLTPLIFKQLNNL